MYNSRNIALFCFLLLAVACKRVPVTGRKQLNLVPNSLITTMAFSAYDSVLKISPTLPATDQRAQEVTRVGTNIRLAVEKYMLENNLSRELKNFNWDFNTIHENTINAWCMPGGKVVVYTGLLNITQNEAALAVVMGHEFTHAVAHHGNERMSQVAVAQGLEIAGNIFTSGNQKANNIFTSIFAPTAQVAVLLPNSRNQEYEADHFGLNFAAMAGYNPREAIPFWQRMSAAASSGKPPEFLSTHPSDENRITKLQSYMPEALNYYKPMGK